MYIPYIFSAVMAGRLIFLFRDHPLTLKRTFGIIIIQTAALLIFEFNLVITAAAAVFAAFNLLLYVLEKKLEKRNLLRLVWLLIFLLLSVGINYAGIKPYPFFAGLFPGTDHYRLALTAAGVLFILNEANFLIRLLFELFNVLPAGPAEMTPADGKTYYAGRVIGMLERLLVFFFIMIGEFSAIGFVIAAKGFTRFKELDNRDFAEYVLIGTLLSALIAIVVSIYVKQAAGI